MVRVAALPVEADVVGLHPLRLWRLLLQHPSVWGNPTTLNQHPARIERLRVDPTLPFPAPRLHHQQLGWYADLRLTELGPLGIPQTAGTDHPAFDGPSDLTREAFHRCQYNYIISPGQHLSGWLVPPRTPFVTVGLSWLAVDASKGRPDAHSVTAGHPKKTVNRVAVHATPKLCWRKGKFDPAPRRPIQGRPNKTRSRGLTRW